MSTTPDLEAQELIHQLRNEWARGLEAGLLPFKSEIATVKNQLQSFGQRMSRPPGSAGPAGSGLETNMLSLSRQLANDAAFQTWIKSNKVPSSGYATELKLPPSRKAAITNISPTEHISTIYGPPALPLRVRTLMPTIPVTSGTVEYTKETAFTPSAAVVPEGATKPAMAATFALATAKIATIANIVKASVQALADVPQLQIWLDNRLMYSCSLKEEDVILNGDATNAIQGLMQLATPFAYTPAATDNAMDVIARAAGHLQGLGYAVDGVVMNSDDYTAARLLKSTIGTYLFLGNCSAGPDDESVWESTPLMWQTPLVLSPSMPAGEFLIGGFQQSTVLFSRDTLNVQVAFQNEDDFIKNLVCLRGELRSGIAVPVPAGLLKGSFAGLTPLTQAAAPAHAAHVPQQKK